MKDLSRSPFFVSSVHDLEEYCRVRRPDVLSVDLFDTILLRDCLSPEDILWRIVALEPTKRLGLDRSWVALRRKIERDLVRGSRDGETTLADIYARLATAGKLTDETAQEAMKLEIEQETRSWRANRELLESLTRLRNSGIAIIVYSDTYLPNAVIRRWLDNHFPHATLFCSSETRCTKRSGSAFAFLKRRYPGKKLMHIGDDLRWDGITPRKYNIESIVIEGRGRFSSSLPPEVSRVARLRRLERFPECVERRLQTGADMVVAQWAYAWSLFLACYLEDLKRYVDAERIEQVWFTSRDCESLYKCLLDTGRISEFPNAKYLYASRLSLSPLANSASTDAAQFGQKLLVEAYLRQIRGADHCEACRIVAVDVGWNGTLQRTVQQALGQNVSVYGYYVSLSPRHAADLHQRSKFFFNWDRGALCWAMTEVMFGFVEDSCTGYACDDAGTVAPIFGDSKSDKSDKAYTAILRECLNSLLRDNWNPPDVDGGELERACYKMVRRLHMFPRAEEVARFQDWSIGTNLLGTDASLLTGEHASWKSLLMMRVREDNFWPNGALAYRVRNRYVAYVLQYINSTGRSLLSRQQRRKAMKMLLEAIPVEE